MHSGQQEGTPCQGGGLPETHALQSHQDCISPEANQGQQVTQTNR